MAGMTAVLGDRIIAFHRVYVDVTGSVASALMLSQAVYWTPRAEAREGWFYKTREEWTAETGLSRREQESSRKRLRELGILEEERRGVPAQLWYRVNMERLEELVTYRLEGRNCTNKEGGNAPTRRAECAHPSYTDYETRDDSTEESAQARAADAAVPDLPVAVPEPKPRTEKQRRQDVRYERMAELYESYCHGIGLNPATDAAKAGEARAFRELKTVVDLTEPEAWEVEALTRYLAAETWRDNLPTVNNVVQAYPGWVARGRPKTPKVKRRVNGQRGYSADELMARFQAKHGKATAGDGDVIDVKGRAR